MAPGEKLWYDMRERKELGGVKKKVIGYLALILAITAAVLLIIALRG